MLRRQELEEQVQQRLGRQKQIRRETGLCQPRRRCDPDNHPDVYALLLSSTKLVRKINELYTTLCNDPTKTLTPADEQVFQLAQNCVDSSFSDINRITTYLSVGVPIRPEEVEFPETPISEISPPISPPPPVTERQIQLFEAEAVPPPLEVAIGGAPCDTDYFVPSDVYENGWKDTRTDTHWCRCGQSSNNQKPRPPPLVIPPNSGEESELLRVLRPQREKVERAIAQAQAARGSSSIEASHAAAYYPKSRRSNYHSNYPSSHHHGSNYPSGNHHGSNYPSGNHHGSNYSSSNHNSKYSRADDSQHNHSHHHKYDKKHYYSNYSRANFNNDEDYV